MAIFRFTPATKSFASQRKKFTFKMLSFYLLSYVFLVLLDSLLLRVVFCLLYWIFPDGSGVRKRFIPDEHNATSSNVHIIWVFQPLLKIRIMKTKISGPYTDHKSF